MLTCISLMGLAKITAKVDGVERFKIRDVPVSP